MSALFTELPANYRQLLRDRHAVRFAPNVCVTCGVEPGFPDFCPWCQPADPVLVDDPTESPCSCAGCPELVPVEDVRGQCDYCWTHCELPVLSFSPGNVDPWVTTGTEPF